MIELPPESVGLLVYGMVAAALALSTATEQTPRARIHIRNLWLCTGHGLLQGSGGLLCLRLPDHEWVHVLLHLLGGYSFYVVGWFSWRDLIGAGRRLRWFGPVLLLPCLWAGAAVAGPEPLLGLHRLSVWGLSVPGATVLTLVFALLAVQARRQRRQGCVLCRLMAATALSVAGYGIFTVLGNLGSAGVVPPGSCPVVLGNWETGLLGACCLLGAIMGVAGLLRVMNAEALAREFEVTTELASRTADLAVLNATLEERVRARTEELLKMNTELGDEIARHRRTELELGESSARLQALFDQSAVGITFLSTEGCYVRVNARFAELVGRVPAELIGRSFAEISEPEEVEQDMRQWPDLLAGRRHRFAREKSYVRPDGVRVWVSVNLVVVRDEQQRIRHVIGIYEDIGERRRTADSLRESEHRLLLALTASRQTLFEFSVATRSFTFAPEFVRHLGYEPETFPTDHARWTDLTHVEDRPEVLRGVRACLAGAQPTLQFEFRQRTAAGAWVWILARGSVVERDGTGRPLRLLGTFTDVTERRAMDERMRRTQRLESIGSLAGGIAHDLNNALVPLLAGVAFLREYVPADEHDLIAAMETSARRAASMVQQLLVFARGAEGRKTPVQPGTLVEEMEHFVRSTFPPVVRFHSSCLCKAAAIAGDPTQLHQVLLNLCVNARDAMPHGGQLGLEVRPVEVEAAQASEHDGAHAGPHVLFVVSDTGTGIPPAIRERIFDPFFTTKGPEKGTGLGLSTVLGIVRGHGGFVELQTEEGKGTRFLVYLPVAGGTPAADPSAREENLSLPAGRGRRLLVIDDEAVVRTMVGRVFAGSGFEVVQAGDGVEGLAWLTAPTERFDLLLLDMAMPNLAGHGVLQRMREQVRPIPTVAMSGNFEKGEQAKLRESGVVVLEKPFSREDLIRAVRTVLGVV